MTDLLQNLMHLASWLVESNINAADFVFLKVWSQPRNLPRNFRVFPDSDDIYGDAGLISQQCLAPAVSAKRTKAA